MRLMAKQKRCFIKCTDRRMPGWDKISHSRENIAAMLFWDGSGCTVDRSHNFSRRRQGKLPFLSSRKFKMLLGCEALISLLCLNNTVIVNLTWEGDCRSTRTSAAILSDPGMCTIFCDETRDEIQLTDLPWRTHLSLFCLKA
ncbi:hypothetical protein TNCV_601221 [Trichonephila clavipes]|nr:hypothetical protein TNCV_601221 [Trichonephila clavipes]